MRTLGHYCSDISHQQFDFVRPLQKSARKTTKTWTVDLYEVFFAVLYLLHTGCQWRALINDFPKWRTVRAYFAKRIQPNEQGVSLLEQALKIRLARPERDWGAAHF